jgi:hypothetical protein
MTGRGRGWAPRWLRLVRRVVARLGRDLLFVPLASAASVGGTGRRFGRARGARAEATPSINLTARVEPVGGVRAQGSPLPRLAPGLPPTSLALLGEETVWLRVSTTVVEARALSGCVSLVLSPLERSEFGGTRRPPGRRGGRSAARPTERKRSRRSTSPRGPNPAEARRKAAPFPGWRRDFPQRRWRSWGKKLCARGFFPGGTWLNVAGLGKIEPYAYAYIVTGSRNRE